MRLLKLGVYHPAYLTQFSREHPGLATQPYATQHAALMDDCFGSADFWTTALAKLGYETGDVIASAEAMQKRWAQEHDITWDETRWLFDIAAAQVRAFQPDVLIVADYSTITAAFLRRLKDECPFLRLILVWCGAPFGDSSIFRECDIVISCVPELVRQFLANGHRCYHLNHAFAPRILKDIKTTAAPTVNFAFLGSIVKSTQFHHEREQILAQIVEQTDLQIWSDVVGPSPGARRRRRARQHAYDTLRAAERIGVPPALLAAAPLIRRAARWVSRPRLATPYVDERIARRARPALFGLKMFQQLRDARVALNTHIDISSHSASNMRLFEATGVGTCLLTDWKSNLRELFEPDVEVLTYCSADECVEKVRYILAHESKRRAVAVAGQRRTLRDHNFDSRAAQIDEIICGALSKQ